MFGFVSRCSSLYGEESLPQQLGDHNETRMQAHAQTSFAVVLFNLKSKCTSGIISGDMTERRTNDDKVLVYNLKTEAWEEIPHGLGAYVLGFPCTPWSLHLPCKLINCV